jgi:phasin family protein
MTTATSPGANAKGEAFAGFKMPKVNTEAILDSYKKNLEILGLINKMSVEVCTGITKLQTAFMKQLMVDLGSINDQTKNPSEAMAKFSEVARDSMVKAIGNSKQISEMITGNNNELTAAIAKRFKDSIEDAKNAANKK